jgi:hypothetical protein
VVGRRALAIALLVVLLATAAAAAAARSITKNQIGFLTLPPESTGTLNVPYPDALEYGNARYSGSHELRRKPHSTGSAPDLAKVRILAAGSAEGGSLYRVRAHNANAAGTAPVQLIVTATTIEPLPHH